MSEGAHSEPGEEAGEPPARPTRKPTKQAASAFTPEALKNVERLAETRPAFAPETLKNIQKLADTRRILTPEVLKNVQTLAARRRALTPETLKSVEKLAETESLLPSLAKIAEAQRALTPDALKNVQRLAEMRRATEPRTRPSLAELFETERPAPGQASRPPRRTPAASPPLKLPPPRPSSLAMKLRRQALRAVSGLDPGLGRRLEGAWDQVRSGGPDAVSQAAHSLVELLDWTLRLAAPDGLVAEWHTATGRPADELTGTKPTRSLRVRYILRDRDPDGSLSNFYVKQVCELHRVLEGIKHRRNPGDIKEVAALAINLEAILCFLFLPEEPGG